MVIQFKNNFANEQEPVIIMDQVKNSRGFLLAFGVFMFWSIIWLLFMTVRFFVLLVGVLFSFLRLVF